MKFTGIPLAHVKAAPPSGWLPMWSAKKDRQTARRKARREREDYERMQKAAPPREQELVLPRPFWQRTVDRVRRFLSRRMV